MEGRDLNYYQNKYLVNSIRLETWDYSLPGMYFITICTHGRILWLGHIRDDIMGLNIIGCIVNKYYLEIPNHYRNCRLDEFVIMPNHIHGIIEILDNKCRDGACNEIDIDNEIERRGAINRASTGGIIGKNNPMINNNSLGAIVRWFKGRTTYEIHKIGYPKFQWQSRFYEHIIRVDTESLDIIRHYIKYNPKM